jgi:hypothetical protein
MIKPIKVNLPGCIFLHPLEKQGLMIHGVLSFIMGIMIGAGSFIARPLYFNFIVM